MKIATITMAHNESIILPLWAQHYGREFGSDNLFCVDHGSDDGATNKIVANTIRIPRDKFDENARARFVSSFHESLLNYYDLVIFTDCDEFLVADPAAFPNLRSLIEARCEQTLTAFGYDVVQVLGNDAPIDLQKPILAQRRFIRAERSYSKTLISRVPVRFHLGFHRTTLPPHYDRHLFLFHLKFMDEAIFRATHANRMAVTWVEGSDKIGTQWRLDMDRAIAKGFLSDGHEAPEMSLCPSDDAVATWEEKRSQGTRIYRIPERFRDSIDGLSPQTRTLAAAGSPLVAYDSLAEEQKPARRRPEPAPYASLAAPSPPVVDTDTPENIVTVSHEGRPARFAIKNSADHIQSFLVRGHYYELRQLTAHHDVIPRGATVLDIGANIGNHTIFYGLYTNAARVIPFEPNTIAQSMLRRNVELNAVGLRGRVDLTHVGIALASAHCRLGIVSSPANNLGATTFAKTGSTDTGTICAMPLDQIGLDGRVHFMKIDTEGMELEVLAGAVQTIGRNRPVIFIEVNTSNERAFWEWADQNRYEITKMMWDYPSVKNYLLFPRS